MIVHVTINSLLLLIVIPEALQLRSHDVQFLLYDAHGRVASTSPFVLVPIWILIV